MYPAHRRTSEVDGHAVSTTRTRRNQLPSLQSLSCLRCSRRSGILMSLGGKQACLSPLVQIQPCFIESYENKPIVVIAFHVNFSPTPRLTNQINPLMPNTQFHSSLCSSYEKSKSPPKSPISSPAKMSSSAFCCWPPSAITP
jgi:hypothetical protein